MELTKDKDVFISDFSKEIYNITYKYDLLDDCIDDTFKRVAKDLASIESNPGYWTEQFYDLLCDFKFVPGGRIISNAGIENLKTTYINCFVSGFRGVHQDSMESIMDELKRQALILKSEGGYGINIDVLRPRGGFVNGIANFSCGSIKILELWDKQANVITSGVLDTTDRKDRKKKIRKGAQMVTMSCWHPDIIEFITAKQQPGRLVHFNMSVLLTDKFMRAVENNEDWNLIFPDYESDIEKYNNEWDGNIKKWIQNGGKIKIYNTIKAKELYNIIMQSTYNRNEPGILFVDTINKNNNLWYIEYINATNPCGEQVLPIGGVCLLGSFNLTQFIDFEKRDFDYEKIKKYIPIAVRLLDNVNDKTYVPLPENYENLREKRRIGIGVMGYGSALMMMRIRYGSDEAIKKTDKFYKFFIREIYKASIELAKEKGHFPLLDKEKYIQSEFIQRNFKNDDEIINGILKYGIRNSHLTSIQPTGNTSILANNVSGGIEPVFLPVYKRTSIVSILDGNIEKDEVPVNVDFINKKYTCSVKWYWEKEGDENILVYDKNGIRYKYDASRGLTKETVIYDYAVYFLKERGMWDEKAEWAFTALNGLTLEDHIKTLECVAKYVDSAISKTINVPNNYSYEEFKNLYFNAYKTGYIKGLTTYREGTMTVVLSDVNSNNNKKQDAYIQRPKEVNADVYVVSVYNKKENVSTKWNVFIGKNNDMPIEVFAFKEHPQIKLKNNTTGKLIKEKINGKTIYKFKNDSIEIDNIKEYFETDEEEAITRLISLSLRNNINIELIINQLLKSEGAILSFAKAIARCLKKYISKNENDTALELKYCEKCNQNSIKEEVGCKICINCGYSYCI